MKFKEGFFRILIVDDSLSMRQLLHKLIDMNDITPYVFDAKNGKEALTKFQKILPDLVLLDLQMPEMDGITTLRLMKKMDPSVKVMMMSLSGSKNDTQDAIKYGACDFLLKPFDRNEFAFKVIKNLREKANEDKITELQNTTEMLDEKFSKMSKMIKK
ncbi:MAG: response regulator [Crenarchaeota archaeon]|nr:MAG: response regulator [Thermoproteota archaeon]RDJ33959.1 MAG: response regulator [Thermoproteota archaeon]RDJ36926.1 MAG: response regulator [Thermoproteota archaeon]RDJ37539.1 MAG: response regulator [Thermoproteota archaeon]